MYLNTDIILFGTRKERNRMSNINVKNPCRNCVYFAVCGDNTRTEICNGRQTKTDRKKVAK